MCEKSIPLQGLYLSIKTLSRLCYNSKVIKYISEQSTAFLVQTVSIWKRYQMIIMFKGDRIQENYSKFFILSFTTPFTFSFAFH